MTDQKVQKTEQTQTASHSILADPIGADFLICPECRGYTTTKDMWWPAADLYTGLVFGFWIICEHCKEKSYINLLQLGKPPLFDLSKHYTFRRNPDE